jgi:NADH-quinone oxidoreductase subunit G
MAKVTINGKVLEVENGKTIIQVCDEIGVEIPRFCYHEKLKIAGNCRMCLVEIENMPKPIASCAMQATDGMNIHTDSPMVKKAREGVMEFLLINHPLDCPICDEGGECELQDQAMVYGRGKSRFEENKRAVEKQNFGPLIKPHMTRCIHCTRCIRFSTEVAGVEELGATGRGEDMEVGTYIKKSITSELSGNMIDICPVGALTSKPFAFKARSWELRKTYSIDVHDAVGSNIRIDSRGLEVMRILPFYNYDINEEWISDKTRFAYDGLKNQRLDKPYIRHNGRLIPATWEEAINKIKAELKNTKAEEIAAIAGGLTDCETLKVMKDILDEIGSPHMDFAREGIFFDSKKRSSYLFNTTIAGIEESDLCLIIGANPRQEATLVDARIRKRYLQGDYDVYTIGCASNFIYEIKDLGDKSRIIDQILSGKHKICKEFAKAKKPMMIIGYGALKGEEGRVILAKLAEIANEYNFINKDWNGFNILHRSASTVGALDIGFVPGENGRNYKQILDNIKRGIIKILFVLGDDELDPNKLKDDGLVIYIGHHGDKTANVADIILPGAAYTEKDATYVNLEGRAQRTYIAVPPPGEAKTDWEILLNIVRMMKIKLPYSNLDELRQEMSKLAPSFSNLNMIIKEKWNKISTKSTIEEKRITPVEIDYYLSNAICRASQTMANCVKELVNGK